jgi:hypothetical protein
MAEGCKLAEVFATFLAISSAQAQDFSGQPQAQAPRPVAEIRAAVDLLRARIQAAQLQAPLALAKNDRDAD